MASDPAWDIFTVNGMIAVITGGGSGIGLMQARALEANGAAKVYIIGRRWETLEKAAKQSKYGKIIPLPGDVTNAQSLKDCAEYIRAREGYINVLITCAGAGGPGFGESTSHIKTVEGWQDFFLSKPMKDFTETYNINVTSSFYTSMAFLGLLDAGNKQGNLTQKSQVIIMSSVGGYSRLLMGAPAYGSSKAAVKALMLSCATQFAPYQIRFNSLALGGFRSELTAGMALFQGKDPAAEEEGGASTSFVPLGRVGRETEAAGTVLFLASSAGAYCNGLVLIADGGRLSMIPGTYS